jgi:hypothetical protein
LEIDTYERVKVDGQTGWGVEREVRIGWRNAGKSWSKHKLNICAVNEAKSGIVGAVSGYHLGPLPTISFIHFHPHFS